MMAGKGTGTGTETGKTRASSPKTKTGKTRDALDGHKDKTIEDNGKEKGNEKGKGKGRGKGGGSAEAKKETESEAYPGHGVKSDATGLESTPFSATGIQSMESFPGPYAPVPMGPEDKTETETDTEYFSSEDKSGSKSNSFSIRTILRKAAAGSVSANPKANLKVAPKSSHSCSPSKSEGKRSPFRARTPKGRRKPRITSYVTIRFDPSYFRSCTSIIQTLSLVLNLIITVLNIVIQTCTDVPKDLKGHKEVKDPKDATRTVQDQGHGLFGRRDSCVYSDCYVVIAVIGFVVVLIFMMCYIFHLVEAANRCPWLLLESTFYGTIAILYLILSVIVFIYGGWFILVGVLGLFNMLLFLILFLVKFTQHKQGVDAQPSRADPDNNAARTRSPNLRFQVRSGIEEVKQTWKI